MPVFILGNTITSLTQSAASARRVFEVVDAPIEVKDIPDAITLPPLQGRVSFERVAFRYAGSETLHLTVSRLLRNQAKRLLSWDVQAQANRALSILFRAFMM